MSKHRPRRRRRKEARPPEIIEAARLTFLENGFAMTRVEDIARRAGVSKGTVYIYFPSKEALFEAVVHSNLVPVIEAVTRGSEADEVTNAVDQLKLIARTLYREIAATDRRRLLHMIIAEGPQFPWLTEVYHREILTRAMKLIRVVLRRGEERGELRLDGLDEFPLIVVAPIVTATIFSNLFSDYQPLDIDRYANAHMALLERALCASK